jgi:hypothetical protein
MRRAVSAIQRCLQHEGLMEGDSISFDVHIEARTGKVRAAEPRGLHRSRPALGSCIIKATANHAVSPAPASELVKPYEVTL